MPAVASHTFPMLSVAEALVKAGHRVLVHTGERDYTKVQAAGAELVPMSQECNILFRVENSSVRLPLWIPNFARGFWRFRSEMLTMVPDMVAELEIILRREQVDCIIGDYLGFGASYAAERLGIPYVTVSMSWATTLNADALPVAFPIPLPNRIVHALFDLIFPLGRTRKQVGLPPRPKNAPAEFCSVVVSKLLNIVLIDRDFLASQNLQENQVFVGPTTFQMPRTTDEQPLGVNLEPGTVLLSTTTAANMCGDLYRRLLKAIAQMRIPLLATIANDTDIPSGLGDNVRVERFVPHDEVVPYVKAIVTHGGAGMVGRAFRSGIPMLIIPHNGDQIPTAIQAAKLGLAYYLPEKKATAKAIQSKLKALLKDDKLHARLKMLSEKLSSMDSPLLAVKAIEDVLQDSQIKQEEIKTTDKIASIY